ncbi:hypothetical protein E2C01_068238 [Portunus trituberculatus]|uniref:Uncharacterized protein n=1 Tax=Portunus trituberculatus TaxID=210409 RepID=A0A5B7HVZ6_PORTR|nr:hypothetical protein [Portunus trituberculatus]
MHRNNVLDTPRHSSSSSASKRPSCEKVLLVGENKTKRNKQKNDGAKQRVVCASPPSLAGPSHNVNNLPHSADHSTKDAQLDCLSMVISGLIAKLNGNPPAATVSVSGAGFIWFSQLAHPDAGGDNADFLRALEELSDHFQGEEKKGEPISEHLASTLNASLRCRPSSDGVKSACSKIKLSSNVPNLSVPATNSTISSAMTVGGKLIQ